ncbi:unnamed protein product [Microthlaspi erraticum]|uniref:Uncharacterized protein n=1 Tax=Microthlaspi erraticum TaxID=1685480 RepID=A0A6D2I5G6_9BRAS|nr:unnamed protein product [Microthlaspi erraticum]
MFRWITQERSSQFHHKTVGESTARRTSSEPNFREDTTDARTENLKDVKQPNKSRDVTKIRCSLRLFTEVYILAPKPQMSVQPFRYRFLNRDRRKNTRILRS